MLRTRVPQKVVFLLQFVIGELVAVIGSRIDQKLDVALANGARPDQRYWWIWVIAFAAALIVACYIAVRGREGGNLTRKLYYALCAAWFFIGYFWIKLLLIHALNSILRKIS